MSLDFDSSVLASLIPRNSPLFELAQKFDLIPSSWTLCIPDALELAVYPLSNPFLRNRRLNVHADASYARGRVPIASIIGFARVPSSLSTMASRDIVPMDVSCEPFRAIHMVTIPRIRHIEFLHPRAAQIRVSPTSSALSVTPRVRGARSFLRIETIPRPIPLHTPHTSTNFLPALFEFLVLSPQFRDDLAKFIELLTQVAVGFPLHSDDSHAVQPFPHACLMSGSTSKFPPLWKGWLTGTHVQFITVVGLVPRVPESGFDASSPERRQWAIKPPEYEFLEFHSPSSYDTNPPSFTPFLTTFLTPPLEQTTPAFSLFACFRPPTRIQITNPRRRGETETREGTPVSVRGTPSERDGTETPVLPFASSSSSGDSVVGDKTPRFSPEEQKILDDLNKEADVEVEKERKKKALNEKEWSKMVVD
ncbi:hypothetical protein B0H14DRAFT_3427184 [Mycena olivaceomarginata]|nr:hypothetical protein B0H14DRAFT_3427184 [Mycena olivaceomarginata]